MAMAIAYDIRRSTMISLRHIDTGVCVHKLHICAMPANVVL